MADGLAWDDLAPELEGPGVGIRRMDADGLAMCLIRLDAGLRTDPLFAGLPNDQCQCAHWGYIISGTMRVHGPDGVRDYEAGETYYWNSGHNLEAVTADGVPRDHPLRGLRRTHGALQARHVGLIAARHRREPVQGRLRQRLLATARHGRRQALPSLLEDR